MKKLVASLLTFALALTMSPVNLIAAGRAFQAGSISGVANLGGKPMANTVVRLRSVDTGNLIGSVSSNAAGEFSFTGLPAGNFVVETVSANGTILGTSAVALSPATMVVANLTVNASAAAAAAAGVGTGAAGLGAAAGAGAAGGGMGTGLLIAGIAAAGLGATGIAVALHDSSPSQ